MQSKHFYPIITIGLAIFSMFFGAGNLIYPLKVGIQSGQHIIYGLLGFMVTAVCIPLSGLIAMILFDGNYRSFFHRLGTKTGDILILLCMLFIGPIVAIPRIVTLSHTMIAPFIPLEFFQTITLQSSLVFALIFLGVTFFTTFRENRIVALLGHVISPLLLASLAIIILKGLITAQLPVYTTATPWKVFGSSFIRGYETLDLLGGIFFSSIVIHLLKNISGGQVGFTKQKLALIGLKSGLVGVSILALVYIGMGLLSLYHGHGLNVAGDLFRTLASRVLGEYGALIIGTAVLMACLSTAIALAAVTAEYFQLTILKKRIPYSTSLLITLALCVPISTFGLDYILGLTAGPVTYIGYPVLIMLTICNIAYKLFNFRPVKIPVALTLIVALISYMW